MQWKGEKMKKVEESKEQEILFSTKDFKIFLENKESGVQEKALHEALEIKYFYEGNSMIMIDDDVIIAEPGDITVVNPYEIHTNVKTDSYKGRYILLMVDLDFFAKARPNGIDLRTLLIAEGQKFNHRIRDNKRLQTIISRVAEELEEQKEHYRLVVYSLMSEFFALLLREEIDHEATKEWRHGRIKRPELIAPALSKILKDYRQHVTVEELATLCNVSKYYFCRVFKREMGVTAIQYLTNYRISLAEAKLKDHNKSITQIAYECGFDDISYFYRCYKKIKGISPKSVRRP